MKALMVMYDSLRRDLLSVYGGPIPAPNFERLAAHTVCFDKSYVGSLPCMPARRELHTGRYNFLHRSWGPMEPYDDSMPEILKKARHPQPPCYRPLPLCRGWRLHLPQPLFQLELLSRPGK